MTERAESTDSTFWADGDDRSGLHCYRTLVATVDGGVFQLDGDDRLVAVDDTLLELTGYARKTVLGRGLSAFFDPAAVDRIERHVRERADAGADDGTAIDVGIRTADEETLPCTLRLNGIESGGETERRPRERTGREKERTAARGTAPEHGHTIGIVRPSEPEPVDTDQPDQHAHHASDPTTSSNESLAPVLEAADVGVFVLDDELDTVWINDATERYFGIDRADVCGRNKRRVIEDTIADRVADPDRFRETVAAAYEHNDSAERFECRITPAADRAERWLEHRSRPIESGPYAGGRVELYYDVTDQRRRARQLRRLNEAVGDWLEADTHERAADRACRSLGEVLGLELNGIFRHDPEREVLRPLSVSEAGHRLFDEPPTFAKGEGIAWRVFDSGRPEIYDDVTSDPDVYNPETPIRSEIILPIGSHGVVIAGSKQRNAFDDGDLSLAKIAASSLEATFDRIDNERRLERERAQTEELIRTAPVAITVEDAAGETVLSNRQATESPGLPARRTIEQSAADSGVEQWTVYDANGNRLEADRTPSARARATGDPVFDEELSIAGPDGERRWFSVNAAPVFAPDGSLERVVSVGEDITDLKAHERELERRKHELETELSEILGRVSDAFYALDEEWRFTHVNDRAAEILQHAERDLLGRSLWEVYGEDETETENEGEGEGEGESEDDTDLVRENFHAAMETQQRVNFETYAEPLEAWLEFNVYPSETGLSVYFRDVTERKERERDLATYETIVETIEDGIYVLDDDERFAAVNEAYATLTGYDRAELLGTHASLVVDEDVMDLARDVAVDQADVSTVETELLTRDGEHVPVEATVTTLETGDGERERIGVVRDVTERRERQRRLEESEQRYRTLVEHFPNGIVALFDDELRYTAAGGQLVGDLGIDPDEAIGQTIFERYPDDLVAAVEPHFRAALEGEERSFEVSHYDRDLQAHTLPIRTGGEIRTGMLVVQDVTERKAYERRLEASNERLEQFAYAASHDLQEPLRMVSSYLQLIDRRYGDELDADGREFLEFAVDGAERMTEMIEGLLEYSRIETRGDPLEPVALETVLEDVRDDLQLRIDESDAAVRAEPLPRVRGDAGQLRQVFQNLLSNAIEYSGDGPPRVEITAERDGSQWLVSVSDDGIGIDPDDQERVFEVFQRLHSHEEHAGTGIGLTLCKRIVERHGGEIRLESEPGAGTTVTVALPAVGARAGDGDERT